MCVGKMFKFRHLQPLNIINHLIVKPIWKMLRTPQNWKTNLQQPNITQLVNNKRSKTFSDLKKPLVPCSLWPCEVVLSRPVALQNRHRCDACPSFNNGCWMANINRKKTQQCVHGKSKGPYCHVVLLRFC